VPIYEYQCQKCRFRFEKLQRLSDPPPGKCPECGGKVTQLMSAPAVQFKGTGWYVTDYARQGSSASGKNGGKPAESKSESKSENKSENKSESKPESKSEAAKTESGKSESKPKHKK
jgi:putative FmdB family regulatory protein